MSNFLLHYLMLSYFILSIVHPLDIWVHNISDILIVVVIDVQPGLDAEGSVPHPVVVVIWIIIWRGHHSSNILHIQLRFVARNQCQMHDKNAQDKTLGISLHNFDVIKKIISETNVDSIPIERICAAREEAVGAAIIRGAPATTRSYTFFLLERGRISLSERRFEFSGFFLPR